MIHIGLPQWQHSAWNRIGLRDLADYSRYFNCVEGNTTFSRCRSWTSCRAGAITTGDDFRFCFKFPSDISHKAALRNCAAELQAFYHCLSLVHQRIGQLWLQLPAAWPRRAAAHGSSSKACRKNSPTASKCVIRHFRQRRGRARVESGLHQRINRVILDSRPVHHAAPYRRRARCPAENRKLPVHAWSPPTNRWCVYRRRPPATTCAGSKPGSKTAAVAATTSTVSVYSYADNGDSPSKRKNLAAAAPGDPRFACAAGLARARCTVLTPLI